MGNILIKNVRILQTSPPFDVEEGVDVLINGSIIEKVGKDIGEGVSVSEVIDGSGKTLIPGNVCAHHHYYSGLSRGMLISAGPQTDFIQVLKEWWWRLDRALDEEACYYSSLICSLDAIAAGTTTAIDHHASPEYISKSLSTIARGMEEVGIRGATCYEVTDRNGGMKEVEIGVEENVRFASEVDARLERGENVLCEAMIGGHAPFTLPDKALDLMYDAVESTGRGLHLHVAEDKYDVVFSHHHFSDDIVVRLDKHKLLKDNTLLVHGVHLSDSEIDLINERGVFLAHNARSNMNNHVGYTSRIPKVKKLVLGTDGCGGNMFEEIKLAFFKHKDDGGPWWPSNFVEALGCGNKLVESVFRGRGKFGRIESGYKADLALLSYYPPTPIKAENAATHFVWGISSNAVETTIVDGKIVYRDRKFVTVDAEKIYSEAQRVAERVWARTDKIKA